MERSIQIERLDSTYALTQLGAALTFEGLALSEASLNGLYDWLEDLTPVSQHVVYYVTGADMNKWYGLNGSDVEYPDDLNIVMIDLNDMHNPEKLILARFAVGGKWLNDVIDNLIANVNSDECDLLNW